jgi:hypothetical protein
MVHNKARVEGCIVEEFKLKEIAYFTGVYFIEHHNVNLPTMQYHVDEDIPCSDLQIFQWKGMTPRHTSQLRNSRCLLCSTCTQIWMRWINILHKSILFSSLLYSWRFMAHLCIYSFNLSTCRFKILTFWPATNGKAIR